jgi:hypothetical protein
MELMTFISNANRKAQTKKPSSFAGQIEGIYVPSLYNVDYHETEPLPSLPHPAVPLPCA